MDEDPLPEDTLAVKQLEDFVEVNPPEDDQVVIRDEEVTVE